MQKKDNKIFKNEDQFHEITKDYIININGNIYENEKIKIKDEYNLLKKKM